MMLSRVAKSGGAVYPIRRSCYAETVKYQTVTGRAECLGRIIPEALGAVAAIAAGEAADAAPGEAVVRKAVEMAVTAAMVEGRLMSKISSGTDRKPSESFSPADPVMPG